MPDACALFCGVVAAQVAILLAPVAYVTHMDSLPMNALATLDTDAVREGRGWYLMHSSACAGCCTLQAAGFRQFVPALSA